MIIILFKIHLAAKIAFLALRISKFASGGGFCVVIEAMSSSPWQDMQDGKHFRLVRHPVMAQELHGHLGKM
jgi:hypothetical protein